MNIKSPLRILRFAIAADRVNQSKVVIEWLASDVETNAIIASVKSLSK